MPKISSYAPSSFYSGNWEKVKNTWNQLKDTDAQQYLIFQEKINTIENVYKIDTWEASPVIQYDTPDHIYGSWIKKDASYFKRLTILNNDIQNVKEYLEDIAHPKLILGVNAGGEDVLKRFQDDSYIFLDIDHSGDFKGRRLTADFNDLIHLREMTLKLPETFDLVTFDASTFKFADWGINHIEAFYTMLRKGGKLQIFVQDKNGLKVSNKSFSQSPQERSTSSVYTQEELEYFYDVGGEILKTPSNQLTCVPFSIPRVWPTNIEDATAVQSLENTYLGIYLNVNERLSRLKAGDQVSLTDPESRAYKAGREKRLRQLADQEYAKEKLLSLIYQQAIAPRMGSFIKRESRNKIVPRITNGSYPFEVNFEEFKKDNLVILEIEKK